ncbi:MAG: hypothetical protein HY896_02835 [Deltaproteobacteria bacterium]|nr:hypothetical protein [Deltaproteobacteria bacterium]
MNETTASRIDLTTDDFRTSGCAWCHPGGGPLEYDRDGFRFDGTVGGLQPGVNPLQKDADYKIFGILAGPDASSYAGAGFFETTSTTGVYPADQLIIQGTMKSVLDPSTGTYKTVGKKYNSPAAGGVAEVDCLMCHYAGRYANLERNYAFPGATAPKLAASLGLVGAGTGEAGLLNITTKGAPGINPNPATSTWSWNEFVGSAGTAGNPVTLRTTDIAGKPGSENCALCHFPDRSLASNGCVDPAKCGPSSKPLGFTAFQKYMAPGSTKDGDEIPGVNGKDGNNDSAWNAVKGRVEGGKRGESINDNLNHDAHMKWPAYNGTGIRMSCTDCHNALEGSYPALTDSSGNVIQPAVTVFKIDHQFAKGDNAPDGKNMDQLDDTVTCESCHVTRTHPNSASAPVPDAGHAGFPGIHFTKISCKTCHIPWLNGPVDQDLADFTVGPYQTFERTQTLEAGATGINRRPLNLWRQRGHGAGPVVIEPFGIMAVTVWANATTQAGEEAGSISPTYQRLGKKAAELLRAYYGDADGDGVFDWPLNRTQGGDKALIVNKPQEIADFITRIGLAGGPSNPVMHFYFNQFTLSHNVRPLSDATNPTLGSPAGGGCLMCHSSSDPVNPKYSPYSVGFFDKNFSLFTQPADGGSGLVQTSLPAASPLSGSLKRINVKFPYKTPEGSSSSVNLSNAAGQTVGNSVGQGQVLGYDAETLEYLMSPKGSYTITAGAGPGGSISPAGNFTVTAGSNQAVYVTPNAGFHIADVVVDGTPVGQVSSYTFYFLTANHSISATFEPNQTYTITASAGVNGTISPSGVTSVQGGTDITCTITPAAGYKVGTLTVDGSPKNPYNTYIFHDVSANHTIAVTFVQDMTYYITASSSGSGTISPSGVTPVSKGGSQTFTITPNPGWKVSRVIVDGYNKGAITSYTFPNVTYNRTIKAYFILQ